LLIVVVLVGCGSKADSKNEGASTTSAATSDAQTSSDAQSHSERCASAWKIVDGYNILAPGASREDYLTLLHKLQRDCPTVAARHGLTGRFPDFPHLDLPECQRLDQENCTMYSKP